MHIEYVLIEKATKDRSKADKARVISIFSDCFPDVTNQTITIAGKRKNFVLTYSINCGTTTSSDSTDYVYNISLVCDHNEKMKSAELLEKAHTAFRCKVDKLSDYHLIVAEDGLSEYYCNKAYPKYQKFERELRHLIFKIVTKAYGNMWTTQTLSPDMKKKLKDDIKSRNVGKKDDVLIEAALHEMTMGQLIDYLFYGTSDISIEDYLDEHLPPAKLRELSKEDLVKILERGRRKSVWNLYFANEFRIDEPRKKLGVLRANRNKVAHCKQFHAEDYKETITYIDLFMGPIDTAIQNATFREPVAIKDVLCGFGEFTIQLSNFSMQVGKIIGPAMKQMSEVGEAILKAYSMNISEELGKTFSVFSKALRNYYMHMGPQAIPALEAPVIDCEVVEDDVDKNTEQITAEEQKTEEENNNADA
mgnify:CR=1 FL=1